MTIVRFYDPQYDPAGRLTYSVIAGVFDGSWVFVRHHERTTWEIPGGHIEEGESSLDAAYREFREETGAIEFDIVCIATYSVEKDGLTGYGRLYFAEVSGFGPIPDISEIAEIKLSVQLPENLTHPDIQPHLFQKALDFKRTKIT